MDTPYPQATECPREPLFNRKDIIFMIRYCLIVITASLMMPIGVLSQCQVRVSGRVINEGGKPVAGARVAFIKVKVESGPKGTVSGGLVGTPVTTDRRGVFRSTIEIYDPGWYWVVATKLDSGYPDTRLSFYIGHKPREVILDCGGSLKGLAVKIGPKAAYIRKISAVDSETNKPIPSATISLWRLSSSIPGLSKKNLSIKSAASVSSPQITKLDLPIPSGVDVFYQISAPGYGTTPVAKLHPTPLQNIYISVKLRRSPSLPTSK